MIIFNTREDTKYIVTCKADGFVDINWKVLVGHNSFKLQIRVHTTTWAWSKLLKLLSSCWDSILKSLHFIHAIAIPSHLAI